MGLPGMGAGLLMGAGLTAGAEADTKSIDMISAGAEYMLSATSTIGIVDDWTIQVSFKTSSTFAGVRNVWAIGGLNDANHIGCRYRDAAAWLSIDIRNSAAGVPLTKAYIWTDGPAVNNWQTWTFTWNGTTGDVLLGYLDGAVKTPNSTSQDNAGTQTATNRKISLGANIVGGNRMDNVIVHSFAIWNSVLDADNIAAIYNGGVVGEFNLLVNKGNYDQSSALKHWHRIGNDAADIGGDQVESGAIDMMAEASNISSADIVIDSPA